MPVTPDVESEIVKVNDTVNRAGRTLQNSASVAVLVGMLNKYTGLDLTAEEALVLLPILISLLAWFRNLAEYRGWIPSTKAAKAEIAPPTNDQGQVLGQVKP